MGVQSRREGGEGVNLIFKRFSRKGGGRGVVSTTARRGRGRLIRFFQRVPKGGRGHTSAGRGKGEVNPVTVPLSD